MERFPNTAGGDTLKNKTVRTLDTQSILDHSSAPVDIIIQHGGEDCGLHLLCPVCKSERVFTDNDRSVIVSNNAGVYHVPFEGGEPFNDSPWDGLDARGRKVSRTFSVTTPLICENAHEFTLEIWSGAATTSEAFTATLDAKMSDDSWHEFRPGFRKGEVSA